MSVPKKMPLASLALLTTPNKTHCSWKNCRVSPPAVRYVLSEA